MLKQESRGWRVAAIRRVSDKPDRLAEEVIFLIALHVVYLSGKGEGGGSKEERGRGRGTGGG